MNCRVEAMLKWKRGETGIGEGAGGKRAARRRLAAAKGGEMYGQFIEMIRGRSSGVDAGKFMHPVGIGRARLLGRSGVECRGFLNGALLFPIDVDSLLERILECIRERTRHRERESNHEAENPDVRLTYRHGYRNSQRWDKPWVYRGGKCRRRNDQPDTRP